MESDKNNSAVQRGYSSLMALFKNQPEAAALQDRIHSPDLRGLLSLIFAYSPYLTRILLKNSDILNDITEKGLSKNFSLLKDNLISQRFTSLTQLMQNLRTAKNRASLLIALADTGGVWELEQVTRAMSEFAEICVQLTLAFLVEKLVEKQEIKVKNPAEPLAGCGIFVLAMGKLGAYELNYSSDIDLIIFFESQRVNYTGRTSVQHSLSKMAQEMVRILQERTVDGYVFRVDLRLRPDPASTPLAMSVAGAITYYETVGQNWERAAFIKARPIAGDMETGYRFLSQINPFIWRKSLDFAAIADIQSIKRQIDERTGGAINLEGHNLKTGIGGIREIEFFCQIHQLIWGGRNITLRTPATCKTLDGLAEAEIITQAQAEELKASYRYLRGCEHRLQMVDDQQTHSLPLELQARKDFAAFMGYEKLEAFEAALTKHLELVHENFIQAFRSHGSLTSDYGVLSFTGVENNPKTLKTLSKMGYKTPASVSERIQAWHRGAYRSTRNQRARELITELTPRLLKSLSENYDPDQAFMKFDEFLSRLPSGVQLFSLFHANPQLLDLISLIMGTAPAMAEMLSKNPLLLDAVIASNFNAEFPDKDSLFNELSNLLLIARDFEDEMDIIRRFHHEKQFQAGVQLICRQADALNVGCYLSDIADTCLEAMLHRVEVHFSARHPDVQPGALAVIALGRLGARELTFGSDIDIVFVYDSRALTTLLSDNHGIYNKLSERFISAITCLTREGRLYETDTRLRPSGSNGALAVSESAFERYFAESAWTFELMAFTRARVISGNKNLREEIKSSIQRTTMRARSLKLLVQDITSLRLKISREFKTTNRWNLKYVRGGLMDMDFLAQYYVLLHAAKHPCVISGSSGEVFKQLTASGLIAHEQGQELQEAHHFMTCLFAILRLCGKGEFYEETAPDGLKRLIAHIMDQPDFEQVKNKLQEVEARVKATFDEVIMLKD